MSQYKQKTVLILANSVHAGDATGRHVCDLARVLIGAGCRVRIGYDGVFTRRDEDIRAISILVRPGDAIPDADLLIVEYSGWYPLADRIRSCGTRSIFWYHGVTPPELWGSEVDRDSLERSVFGCRLARYADISVADSPFGAAELAESSGIPLDGILVVPIAVDLKAFESSPSDAEVRALKRQLGGVNGKVVLYVGRVAGNKRLDLLISATAALIDRYSDLTVAIVGDDRSSPAYVECAKRLRTQIEVLGLQKQVKLLGKVPLVEPYYHVADVLVLPSEHEGFGVPLIEGMAAGVPVIASDAGAMPWVVGADSDAPAALVFKSGSVEGLADAIASVLGDHELSVRLHTRGLARAATFSPEAFRIATLKVFSELTQGNLRTASASAINDPMLDRADVAIREYRVRSRVPILGPVIEWIRANLTSHLKEAYLDRIVERQVMYNIAVANTTNLLQRSIEAQDALIKSLQLEIRLLRQESQDDLSRDD